MSARGPRTLQEIAARAFARTATAGLVAVAGAVMLGGAVLLREQIDEEIVEQVDGIEAGVVAVSRGANEDLDRYLAALAREDVETPLALAVTGRAGEATDLAHGRTELLELLLARSSEVRPGTVTRLSDAARATSIELPDGRHLLVALDGVRWLERLPRLALALLATVLVGVAASFHFGRAFGRSLGRQVDSIGAMRPPETAIPAEIHSADVRARTNERERERSRVLSAGLAHDLRRPLQSLLTRIQVALGGAAPTAAEARTLLEDAQTELRRLGRTIDNIVAWGIPRGGSDLPPATDLHEAIEGRLAAEEATARERSIFFDVHRRGDCIVHIDAGEFVLAVRNLVANAVEWAREGGEVVVTIERHGREVLVVVEDDGPGVDPAEAETIMRPFETGGRNRGGAGYGLGLAIASTIAQRAGGGLEAQQRDGGGARFVLALPAAVNREA